MKILFVSHRLPFPPDKGDKIRAHHFIRCLAKRHEVDVACLADDEKDQTPERRNALKGIARRIAVVPKSRGESYFTALAALPTATAASLPFFHSRRLKKILDRWTRSERYDAIIAHSAPMAQYFAPPSEAVRIVDICDVDSEKWKQYAARAPFWWRAIYAREARLMRAWEKQLAREWDSVAIISEAEAKIFRSFCRDGAVDVVSNGVDADFFGHAAAFTRDPATVMFMGAMDYLPNVEGVLWFAREVWPLVRAKRPDARFVIVGPRPTEKIRALGDANGITVTGYVDDLRAALGRATLCVAPLHIARGVQNKVLEAMAARRPVVATRAAFEGIDAMPDRDLLVEDSARPFADAVLRLLEHRSFADTMGAFARSTVIESHSWDANAMKLEKIVERVRAARAQPIAAETAEARP